MTTSKSLRFSSAAAVFKNSLGSVIVPHSVNRSSTPYFSDKNCLPNNNIVTRPIMVKGDIKCFSAGSEPPVMNSEGMILYGMRFCPFAERVRVVLEAKEIPFQIVNINLKSKPDWFLARNPFGKVPTIEEPGDKLTYESLIVAEYLDDEFDSGLKILPKEHHERAQQKMLFDQVREKFLSKFNDAQFKGGEADLKAFKTALEDLETMLTNKFFSGATVGYVDLMIWPWVSYVDTGCVRSNSTASVYRAEYLKELRGLDYNKEDLPKTTEWISRMLQLPFIKSTVYPLDLLLKFAQGYTSGRMNCDEGL